MFESVEEVQQRFKDARYIANRRISTVVFLAARMGRPVLIEGPAGVGKTELAKTLSDVTGRGLIRLQCYEGLDEGKALYEWSYGKQMLYVQLLREKTGELIADTADLRGAMAALRGHADEFFSREFLLPRPLLAAILSDRPVVLLVVAVGAGGLTPSGLRRTLGALLKNREEIDRVIAEPSRFRA